MSVVTSYRVAGIGRAEYAFVAVPAATDRCSGKTNRAYATQPSAEHRRKTRNTKQMRVWKNKKHRKYYKLYYKLPVTAGIKTVDI